MQFLPIEHLDWAIENQELPAPECNLSLSAMEGFPMERIPFDPSLLAARGSETEAHWILREMLAKRHGVGAEQVCLGMGTSGTNFLAMAALLSPGDEAVVETPCYEPLWRTAAAVGAKVHFAPRRADHALDPEAFAAVLTPRTRLVAVTNLHNPTGRAADPAALAEIGRLAEKAGATLLVDEVYLDGLFSGSPRPAASFIPNAVSTGSLTKIHGLGHLRIGWAAGNAAAVEKIRAALRYAGVLHSSAAETLAVGAFRMMPELLSRSRRRFEENLPVLAAWVAATPGVSWTPPDGGFVGFVRLPEGTDENVLIARLRSDFSTWVTPGRFFRAPGHLRIGIGGPPAELAEGLRRIATALSVTK